VNFHQIRNQYAASSKKVKIELPYYPFEQLLGINLKKSNSVYSILTL
jgi:hypothetical protein